MPVKPRKKRSTNRRRAQTAPDAPAILSDVDGKPIAVDCRAFHLWLREQRAVAVLDAENCDAACLRRGCIRPMIDPRAPAWWQHQPDLDELAARPEERRWLAAQPDPVVAAPDGSMWAVRPGVAVADVVAACAQERPLRPVADL